MLWDGLEPFLQYMLASALSAFWILTGLSRAYERIVTVHTAPRDLAGTRTSPPLCIEIRIYPP